MSKPIKTGILSFGMSGKLFHAPFLHVHDGFELTAVTERKVKAAQYYYPKIRSYNSVDELIDDKSIELVVVNTPNLTHTEFALKALNAGKHVMIEKPVSVTSNQVQEVYDHARERGLQVFPYQNRRYDSDYLSLKSVLDSGKLGSLVELHIRFDRFRPELSAKVHNEMDVKGCGLLYNLGPHLLDTVISLFGAPLKWTKSTGHFRKNTKVEDYAQIHLKYPNEFQIYLTMSLMVADPQPSIVLHGSLGSFVKHRADIQEDQLKEGMKPIHSDYGIEKPNSEGILTTVSNDGDVIKTKIQSPRSNYIDLFENVYDTIRNKIRFPITEQHIIKQIEILES